MKVQFQNSETMQLEPGPTAPGQNLSIFDGLGDLQLLSTIQKQGHVQLLNILNKNEKSENRFNEELNAIKRELRTNAFLTLATLMDAKENKKTILFTEPEHTSIPWESLSLRPLSSSFEPILNCELDVNVSSTKEQFTLISKDPLIEYVEAHFKVINGLQLNGLLIENEESTIQSLFLLDKDGWNTFEVGGIAISGTQTDQTDLAPYLEIKIVFRVKKLNNQVFLAANVRGFKNESKPLPVTLPMLSECNGFKLTSMNDSSHHYFEGTLSVHKTKKKYPVTIGFSSDPFVPGELIEQGPAGSIFQLPLPYSLSDLVVYENQYKELENFQVSEDLTTWYSDIEDLPEDYTTWKDGRRSIYIKTAKNTNKLFFKSGISTTMNCRWNVTPDMFVYYDGNYRFQEPSSFTLEGVIWNQDRSRNTSYTEYGFLIGF